MSVFRTRKKRLAALVALTAAVAVGGGVAYAYWTAGGTGTGSATTGQSTNFVVTSVTDPLANPLVPGAGSQDVAITVTNNAAGAQRLSNVAVTVANADGTPWTAVTGCSNLDYALSTVTFTAGQIAGGGGTSDASVTISMNNLGSNQDACKGVTVPLYIVVS